MQTAKIFENGRSQAVRLPKEYRFSDSEVYINRVGGIIMLIPKGDKWQGMLKGMTMFSEDVFNAAREQGIQEEREAF